MTAPTPSGRQIHPFPARMAPELALDALDQAPPGAVVLDPMCGSGTVTRHAVERGHEAYGFDLDPLAVLLTRVACSHVSPQALSRAAARLVSEATRTTDRSLPWIDDDPETAAFVNYWFAEPQQLALRLLASRLIGKRGPVADALRVALSRTVITKDRGASLARDVSHSRPHRVRDENDYDVFGGFLSAASHIARLLDRPVNARARVRRRDARTLPPALTRKVDLIITSPPYLNAIDYLRGHRMSLVWFGHRVRGLRHTRSIAIGAERGPEAGQGTAFLPDLNVMTLPPRELSMLIRYSHDVQQFARQMEKVLKPGGRAVVVVGDSTLKGVLIENSAIVADAAERAGLKIVERRSRPLPPSSRYLPPPSDGMSALNRRMRSEVVYHLCKPFSGETLGEGHL